LHVHMAGGDADRRQRRDGDQQRIPVGAPATRIVQSSGEEYEPERDYGDALKDTEWAGIEMQGVLRVERVAD